jgi:hypothetical protein
LEGNGDVTFPLHPILVALQIVLDQNEDLGSITRSHPDLKVHSFYDETAKFPADISHMLPPIADRWWEQLGMYQLLIFSRCPAYYFFNEKAKDARREHAAQNPPDAPRPHIQDPKKGETLKLIIPPRQARQDKMVVDEEQPQEPEVSTAIALSRIILISGI